MQLTHPIWLIFPIAATVVAIWLILLDIRRHRVVPFSALHWLRPMDRAPRWARFSRPPIILTLMAASLVTAAVGALHWHLIPSAEGDHPIHIRFAMRRLGRREFAYMRISAHATGQKFIVAGLGQRLVVSQRRLIKGIVLPIPPGLHPSMVTLSTPEKIIWRAHIAPNIFPRVLHVYCAPGVPLATLRTLKSIPWVHMNRRIRHTGLFVGYHLLPRTSMNELILSGPGLSSPIPPGSPVMLARDASVFSDVNFRGVEVRRMAFIARPTGWQTLATVNGHPWILQRHRGNQYDWLITSNFTSASTNWSRFASFVIFIANCARISSGGSPGPRFWLTQAIVPSGRHGRPADRKLPEIGLLFEIAAAALAFAALVGITRRLSPGRKNAPAHPDPEPSADCTTTPD